MIMVSPWSGDEIHYFDETESSEHADICKGRIPRKSSLHQAVRDFVVVHLSRANSR